MFSWQINRMARYRDRMKRINDRRYGEDASVSPDGEYMGHFGSRGSKSPTNKTDPLSKIFRVLGCKE